MVALFLLSGTRNQADSWLVARGSPETQTNWLVHMAPEPGLAHVNISQKGFLEAMIADPP